MSLYTPRSALQPPRPYDAARLIRSSEKPLARLACRVRTETRKQAAAELLLIEHPGGAEEAALLVVVQPSDGLGAVITHALPISASFTFSLNQTPPSPSSSFFHQSSRPGMLYLAFTKLADDDSNHTISQIGQWERRSSSVSWRLGKDTGDARGAAEALGYRSHAGEVLTHGWLQLYPSNPLQLDDDEASPSSAASTSSALTPSTSSATLSTPLSALTIPGPDDEDEDYPNPYLPTFNRTAFLRKRVFLRQNDWASSTPLRIRLATYNVNDKLPSKDTLELAKMVGKGEEHILVFGFQEVDLRSQALLISQGNLRADDWEAALKRGLGESASRYLKVAVTQYVGVMTIVFVRADIMGVVSDVQTSERGIGLLGFGGNKAGVAVRLKVHDTTFCFVNSHLAAFATALDRRRSDYATLLRGLTFSRPVGDVQAAYDEFLPDHPDKLLGIEDAHVLFWMGDLNYRVNMEDDILRAWVGEERWQAILEKDQLRLDIESGKSFSGFNEASIRFAPTYKYVHGSAMLDDRRAPAYTDRILWSTPPPLRMRAPAPSPGGTTPVKTPSSALPSSQSTSFSSSSPSKASTPPLPRSNSHPHISRSKSNSLLSTNFHPVKCTTYLAHTEVMWSDHRPVSAVVDTEVRVVNEFKRAEVLASASREIEKLEEVYRPALEVGNANIDFGSVFLGSPVVREIFLRNVGRVPASFSFRAPAPNKPFCKRYFSVFPSEGVVAPAAEWILRVVALVQEDDAGRLTVGEDDLNDVLVLQVADGKDSFVTLSGSFAPTILGVPLELLPSLNGPMRDTPLAERKAMAPPKPEKGFPALASSTSMSSLTAPKAPEQIHPNGATQVQGDVEAKVEPAKPPPREEKAEMEESESAKEPRATAALDETTHEAPARPKAERSGSRSAKPAKEVWRLLEYLMEHGNGAGNLWVGQVSDEAVLDIINALDTNAPLPVDAALAVSRALLHILRYAPEPLLPKMWHSICLSATSRDEAYAALEGLPGVHTNILIGLTSVAKLCFDLASSSLTTSAAPTPSDTVSISVNGETNGVSPEAKKADADRQCSAQLSALADAIFGGERLGTSVTTLALQEKRVRFLELLLQG